MKSVPKTWAAKNATQMVKVTRLKNSISEDESKNLSISLKKFREASGQLTGRILERGETIPSFIYGFLKEYCKFGGDEDTPSKDDERVRACQNGCWRHTNGERQDPNFELSGR